MQLKNSEIIIVPIPEVKSKYRTIITNATTFDDKNKSQRSPELQTNTFPLRVKENTDTKLTD